MYITVLLIAFVVIAWFGIIYNNMARYTKISELRIGQKVFVNGLILGKEDKIFELPIVGLTINEVHFECGRVPVESVWLSRNNFKNIRYIKVDIPSVKTQKIQ